MKVILCQEVKGLGRRGDIVVVKDGYARNYLIPRSLALEASKKNIERLKKEKQEETERDERVLRQAQALASKLEKTSCTIPVKAGESEKIFGSVTAHDIREALLKQGIDVDKKDILLEEPIKELGVYSVDVKIHPRVIGKVKVWVIKE